MIYTLVLQIYLLLNTHNRPNKTVAIIFFKCLIKAVSDNIKMAESHPNKNKLLNQFEQVSGEYIRYSYSHLFVGLLACQLDQNVWNLGDEGVRVSIVLSENHTVDFTNQNPNNIVVHFGKTQRNIYKWG